MKVNDKCKKQLLFFNELDEQAKFNNINNISELDLFFEYKNIYYNTSDFNLSSSEDYDGMIEMENGKYLLIKYLDDDTVCVGEIK